MIGSDQRPLAHVDAGGRTYKNNTPLLGTSEIQQSSYQSFLQAKAPKKSIPRQQPVAPDPEPIQKPQYLILTMSVSDPMGKCPAPRHMINMRTLAKEIMARHKGPYSVFDDDEIMRLRRFVADPDAEARHFVETREGDRQRAAGERRLTATIITSWDTDDSALSPDEVVELR